MCKVLIGSDSDDAFDLSTKKKQNGTDPSVNLA